MKPSRIWSTLTLLMAFLAVIGLPLAQGQTYPVTNPTYIPTAPLAPTTFTTTGDYTYSVSGISTVTIRVSGTCTSLVSAPQGTNDGTNWTTIQAIPVVGGATVTSITGTGFWRVNTAGFTKTRLHITTLAASCTVAMAGTNSPGTLYLMNPNSSSNPTYITDSTGTYNWTVDSSGNGVVKLAAGTAIAGKVGIDQTTDGTTNKVTVTNVQAPIAAATATATKSVVIGGQYDSTQKTLTDGQQGAVSLSARGAVIVASGADAINVTQASTVGDPCSNPSILKQSVVVDQAQSLTTKIVDTDGSKVIYVCTLTALVSGTNPAVTFKTGTFVAADCDTSTASLTATMTRTDGYQLLQFNGNGTQFKSIAGGQICLTTAALSGAKGFMTYVQQ